MESRNSEITVKIALTVFLIIFLTLLVLMDKNKSHENIITDDNVTEETLKNNVLEFFNLKPKEGKNVILKAKSDETVEQKDIRLAKNLIDKRLLLNGIKHADVLIKNRDEIIINVPKEEDIQELIDEITQKNELELYGIDRTDLFLTVSDGEYMFLEMNEEAEISEFYLGESIKKIGELIVTGKNVKDVYKQYGQFTEGGDVEPYVALEFDNEGTRLFAKGTQKYSNKTIAIVLGNKIISAPIVQVAILDGRASIVGMENDVEADKLVNIIKLGSLPFEFEIMDSSLIE